MSPTRWEFIKEALWDYNHGWVWTMLGLGTFTIWALTVGSIPVNSTMPDTLKKNSTFWLIVLAIYLSGMIFFLILRGAYYKRKLEGEDNIRIIYDETRRECRETKTVGDCVEEVIRVGFRASANTIYAPLLSPSELLKLDGKKQNNRVQIDSVRLHPMVSEAAVVPSDIPFLWFDIFKHNIGSDEIEVCYDRGHTCGPVKLPPGKYDLVLEAGGAGSPAGSKEEIRIKSIKTHLIINTHKTKRWDIRIEKRREQTESAETLS